MMYINLCLNSRETVPLKDRFSFNLSVYSEDFFQTCRYLCGASIQQHWLTTGTLIRRVLGKMATLRSRGLVDSNGNTKPAPPAESSPPKAEVKGGREDKKAVASSASDKTVRVIFFGLVLDLLGKCVVRYLGTVR